MKENALSATESPAGGASLVASELAGLIRGGGKFEIHLAGHSAGGIFLAPFIRRLTDPDSGGLDLTVQSCTLWAPACTLALFDSCYVPPLRSGRLGRLNLFTLSDKCEQHDHCARIYNKSLLYLVSHAFERRPRVPLFRPEGEPLLGMARFAGKHPAIRSLQAAGKLDWIVAPNSFPPGDPRASGAMSHGGFDDDPATVAATLARITGTKTGGVHAGRTLSFGPGLRKSRSVRQGLSAV
jgi:hypothetical protein